MWRAFSLRKRFNSSIKFGSDKEELVWLPTLPSHVYTSFDFYSLSNLVSTEPSSDQFLIYY